MTTNNIVSTPNITGNIGSCEVKSAEFRTSVFTLQTTAVNSCSGEVIASNTYFDYGIIIGIPIVLLVIIMFGFLISIFNLRDY